MAVHLLALRFWFAALRLLVVRLLAQPFGSVAVLPFGGAAAQGVGGFVAQVFGLVAFASLWGL